MLNILKRVWEKWLYSLVGLWTAIREEKSLWAYLGLFPIIIGLCAWLKISYLEWAVVIMLTFLMFIVEIINTALEATIDTISFQYNVKVKKIKDIASAATLVTTVVATISLLIIIIPKLSGVS